MSTPLYSIPQTNPKLNYLARESEIKNVVIKTLDNGRYILGPEVAAFEKAFATYIGVKFAIGVASGTDALELALRACGVKAGDIVITVSHTAVATVSAIERAGAAPVFVDIDPATYCMDINKLEYALNQLKNGPSKQVKSLKAIIPVHLYGHSADIRAINELAQRYDLAVVEDCAQAHGAEYDGKMLGSWGNFGAFSFYPTKNLGGIGDGGMVVTNNEELYQMAMAIREYGWRQRYISDIVGINSRLDELQAAILRIKLSHLDDDNNRRIQIASLYRQQLNELAECLPACAPRTKHVYHQFVIKTDSRDALRNHLNDIGIGTLIHYPVPVHLQPAYQGRIPCIGGMETTESIMKNILSLPMFPELDNESVSIVCKEIIAALKQEL